MAINTFQGLKNPQVRELSDPSWRRWFDILKEQGVDQLADQSVGVRRGMFPPNPGYTPTFNPQFQDTAIQRTNQIGSRTSNAAPAVAGLVNAGDTGGDGGGEWDYRKRRAGKGLGQTKLRVQGQRGGPYAGRR